MVGIEWAVGIVNVDGAENAVGIVNVDGAENAVGIVNVDGVENAVGIGNVAGVGNPDVEPGRPPEPLVSRAVASARRPSRVSRVASAMVSWCSVIIDFPW